jgi:hypothetical protein
MREAIFTLVKPGHYGRRYWTPLYIVVYDTDRTIEFYREGPYGNEERGQRIERIRTEIACDGLERFLSNRRSSAGVAYPRAAGKMAKVGCGRPNPSNSQRYHDTWQGLTGCNRGASPSFKMASSHFRERYQIRTHSQSHIGYQTSAERFSSSFLLWTPRGSSVRQT